MFTNRVKYVLLKRTTNKSKELFLNRKSLLCIKKNDRIVRRFCTMFQPPSDPDPNKWIIIALLCGSLFAMFRKK